MRDILTYKLNVKTREQIKKLVKMGRMTTFDI